MDQLALQLESVRLSVMLFQTKSQRGNVNSQISNNPQAMRGKDKVTANSGLSSHSGMPPCFAEGQVDVWVMMVLVNM